MLSKSEKITFSFLFLGVALFIWGVKLSGAMLGYILAQKVSHGIEATLSFVEHNYPKDQPFVSIGFRIFGQSDVIHVDRVRNKITSDRDFTYKYQGQTISCSIKHLGNGTYRISCGAK